MLRPAPGSLRDLTELLLGYGLILFILWIPETPQRILSPVALIVTLAIVLARRPTVNDLGISHRGLAASLWILPAALALALASVLVAKQIGTLHPLYKGDLKHMTGYVLWTLYQQFLLNDYFMPRLTRLLASEGSGSGSVRSAVCHSAPAESSPYCRHPGLGSDLVRALSPLPQPLCSRPRPGTARPVLRHLRPRRSASSPACWIRVFAISRFAADSVTGCGTAEAVGAKVSV